MTTGLPISTFVDIKTSIEAGGVLRADFGLGLLVSADDAISAGGSGKVQLFRNLAAVTEVFGSGDVEDDAAVWFGADPSPKSLYIGRWATSAVNTSLTGSPAAAVSELTVANAAFSIGDLDLIFDLSSQTDYAGIATAIQTGLTEGRVASVTISTAGDGYSSVPNIAFSGGNPGRPAQAQALLGDGTAATNNTPADMVWAVLITDPGEGYQSTPTITFSGGGAGATQATGVAVMGVADSAFSGATFTFSGGRFTLQLSNTGEIASTFGDGATGTSIAEDLGFVSGTRYIRGSDQETVTEAVQRMVNAAPNGAPVAIMLGTDAPLIQGTEDTREELASWAQAGDYIFGLLDTADQALVSGDTTSHAAEVFERSQSKVEAIYSMPGQRPDIGLMALMSSQNLNNPASIITPHLKSLPGVIPTRITETQRSELERKRTNVYTVVGGLGSLVGGFTGRAGSWLDAQWWLLWLKNEMSLTIFNAQRASRRFNTVVLTNAIHETMQTAVRNGGARPGGRVSAALREDIITTTGNSEFDGVLPAGYLAWVENPGVRSTLDRENRIGRFKVWVASSDAIHKVLGDVVLGS